MYNMYSIVSSIEFDKDADYFAIAGVTKKIKVCYEDRYLVSWLQIYKVRGALCYKLNWKRGSLTHPDLQSECFA